MSKELPDFIAWEIYYEWAKEMHIIVNNLDLSNEEIESLIKFAYRKGMMSEWLSEQIKTIKNLAETAQILEGEGRYDLLPTTLELLFIEAQTVIDENCIMHPEQKAEI